MSMMAMVNELANKGRNGDTILAHISPREAEILKEHGGSGTVNPETGIMEFNIFEDLWDGFKSAVRAVAPVLIPAIAIFVPTLIPAIGTALGASAATASIVGAAALSAGVTLASGGNLKDVLTSAALAGTATFLTPILGQALTPTGTGQLGQIMAGSAAFGAGYTALRGGGVKEMLAAATTGAASAYLGNLASSAIAKMNNMMASGQVSSISQKGATDAVFAAADAANLKAAGLSQSQIGQTLRASGVDGITADYAAAKAMTGMSADDIAANLAANRPTGFYSGEANTHSITAGNNSNVIQRVEDANLVAKDAAQLKAQGLTKAQIVENLQASGVDTGVANSVASYAIAGDNATTIADKVVNGLGYMTSGKVYTNTTDTINRGIGQVMTADQQKAFDALPYKDLVNQGKLTVDEAAVIGQHDLTSTQVNDLLTKGYTGNDLSELIGAGVKPTDLVTLSNTKFPEATINDLLMSGHTVNDISNASAAVNSYPTRLTVDNAVQLLNKGATGSQIIGWAGSTNSDNILRLMNNGANAQTVNSLISNGWDLNKVSTAIESGKFTANDLQTKINSGSWGSWLTSQTTTAPTQTTTTSVAPTAPLSVTQQIANTGLVTATDANVLADSGYTATDVKNLINAGYTAADLTELASTGVPASTLTNLATTKFPEATINDMLMKGVSANDIGNASAMVNLGTATTQQAQQLLEHGVTGSKVSTLLNQPTSALKLLDAGMNVDKVVSLYNSVGLDKVATNIGKLDITAINNSTDPAGTYNKQITGPVAPTQPTTTTTTTPQPALSLEQQTINSLTGTGLVNQADATVLANNGYTSTDLKNLLSAGYTAPDLVELASTGVPAKTLTSLATTRFAEATINDMLMKGISANDIAFASNMVSIGATSQANAEKILKIGRAHV